MFAFGHRCGGDGPHPLDDIPDFGSYVQQLETVGPVSEFLMRESRNAVVYRNMRGELMQQALDGTGTNVKLGSLNSPLSRVIDEKERFLVTDKDTWFFALGGTGNWFHFDGPPGLVQHLYWHWRMLYSLYEEKDQQGNPVFVVYRYRANGIRSVPVATLRAAPGQTLHLAQGHVFPYVFLHTMIDTSEGPHLVLIKWNIVTGSKESIEFIHDLEGPVEEVIQFEKLNTTAVKVDNAKKNLLWWPHGGSCRYYDIGNLPPMILNLNRPILATWSPKSGMTFNFPAAAKKATILKGVSLEAPTENDLWLANDGERLFFAPELNGPGNGKQLWQINISEVH